MMPTMQLSASNPPRLLIVEDEPLLALDLSEVLGEAGYTVAGIAADVDAAVALIKQGVVDIAIIDANLAGESASPVAVALTACGLPYIVMSGYSAEQLAENFPGAAFLQKPVLTDEIIKALKAIA